MKHTYWLIIYLSLMSWFVCLLNLVKAFWLVKSDLWFCIRINLVLTSYMIKSVSWYLILILQQNVISSSLLELFIYLILQETKLSGLDSLMQRYFREGSRQAICSKYLQENKSTLNYIFSSLPFFLASLEKKISKITKEDQKISLTKECFGY